MTVCHPAVEQLLLTGSYGFLLRLLLSGLWFSTLLPGCPARCLEHLCSQLLGLSHPPTPSPVGELHLQQESIQIAPHAAQQAFRQLRGERGRVQQLRGERGRVHACIFWSILPASGWSFSQHIAGQVDLSALQEDT